MTTCPGGTGTESCCTSLLVPGGTYDRGYDGLTALFTSTAYPADVSSFRLDAYEVTVGRFRQFVTAWNSGSGWLPSAGAGKHTHLNGGQGLANVGTSGGHEAGWDATDWSNTSYVDPTSVNLSRGTWTATPGSAATETLPITMVNWYEAYAFCIWDGGFLPSEAEWNYAAAGGSDQRAYPWSPAYPPGSTAIDCTDANYSGCPAGGPNAVGSEPAGNGKWGQSGLAGNASEWTLDWWAGGYADPCTDCAYLDQQPYGRVLRGGDFLTDAFYLLVSSRGYTAPSNRFNNTGFRCARSP